MTAPLSCAAIAKQYGCSAVSVRRWILTGCGPHRLHAVRVGGHWKVAIADMEAFVAALTADALPDETPVMPKTCSEKQKQKRLDAAREQRKALGMRM